MQPFVWFSQAQTSMMQILLVLGVALLLPLYVDRDKTGHRAVLLGAAVLLGVRYIWWRATETIAPFGLTWDCAASWSLLLLELGAIIGFFNASILMMRRRDRSAEADAHDGWWDPAAPPRVALLIATYNEEQEVLERTITGATSVDWPNLEPIVLDDGRREWLRDFCAKRGVRYIARTENPHAKAGNINHALQLLEAEGRPPGFVAILDADFVPHRNFVRRGLSLFRDETVGLVQTPQHFFNADPIQHNLGLSRSYPDEQRFFFDHVQPARDAGGIAICCGTSSISRWAALDAVGGFPTESVTEDFLLTLAMQEKGWRTVYLNEPLTEGLAPEGLKEYITQRARWCLGLMQIARSRLGPFGRNGLRLRDRWSVLDSVFYWLVSFPVRVAGLTYPLLFWYFNVIVVDATVPDVLSYFGVYYFWSISVLGLLSRGTLIPMLHDVSQVLAAISVSRAAVTGLLKPQGHGFRVTAKGGDRSRKVVQWQVMMPFLILLGLTVLGLSLGILFDRFAHADAGDGKAVILFWTVYNLFVLGITILACVELPRRERHVADRPERAIFACDGTPRRVWLASLKQDSARIRGRIYSVGSTGVLRIKGIGDVETTVTDQTADGVRLALLPEPEARRALLQRFYTEGAAPGVVNVRPSDLVGDIARRLSFSNGRD